MDVSVDEAGARTLLEEERTRLQEIRAGLASEGAEASEDDVFVELSNVDQHPADLGTETFEREKDLSILEHIDAQLADVDRALDRLRAGTYGACEACGRPIGEDRLRARPAARFCLEDQARAERGIP